MKTRKTNTSNNLLYCIFSEYEYEYWFKTGGSWALYGWLRTTELKNWQYSIQSTKFCLDFEPDLFVVYFLGFWHGIGLGVKEMLKC